jgi:hypothetical protein
MKNHVVSGLRAEGELATRLRPKWYSGLCPHNPDKTGAVQKDSWAASLREKGEM